MKVFLRDQQEGESNGGWGVLKKLTSTPPFFFTGWALMGVKASPVRQAEGAVSGTHTHLNTQTHQSQNNQRVGFPAPAYMFCGRICVCVNIVQSLVSRRRLWVSALSYIRGLASQSVQIFSGATAFFNFCKTVHEVLQVCVWV